VRLSKVGFISASALLLVAGLAKADYISGTAYGVSSSVAGSTPTSATLASVVSSATEWATFTANGINFSGDANGAYNLGGFLNSKGVASNITYMNGALASTNLDNTLWVFTGSALFTNGQTFNVVHDDGVNMYVNGSPALLAGGPTAPVTSMFTYSGPSGTYNFEFIYTECCGGTADFITTLVPSGPSTPEPGTTAMILIAAPGCVLWLAARRRRG
jgi:hypothetical protein